MQTKIIAGVLLLNVIATGYVLYTVHKQSQELEKVGVALGQVANVFTQSRLVSVDKESGVVVNQVVTMKDVQQDQPSF